MEREYLFAVNEIAELLVDRFSVDMESSQSDSCIESAIIAVRLLIKHTQDKDKQAMFENVLIALYKLR